MFITQHQYSQKSVEQYLLLIHPDSLHISQGRILHLMGFFKFGVTSHNAGKQIAVCCSHRTEQQRLVGKWSQLFKYPAMLLARK